VSGVDNLTTFMYRLSKNSGSFNFLEFQGPVKACTVIALPKFDSYRNGMILYKICNLSFCLHGAHIILSNTQAICCDL
jgi:hypothetical protein